MDGENKSSEQWSKEQTVCHLVSGAVTEGGGFTPPPAEESLK